ncbi:hypothetical protein [Sphingomonas sp. UYP23]
MSAINIFGLGTAILGVSGISISVQAGRQVLAVPRTGREPPNVPVLLMLGFIGLVDVAVTVAGAGIALLPL